ncbi:phosphoribosylamine--glycine ligase [Lacticaseibacillus yichunensis]|uniref:Phosphoribosylamine--glycine ligase n=1 Tax=Lacticaseibacillus yichunensis TaxID=2486015 RepID=A0ABW4CQZ9_9LACO|nr:phosphoribosylamine--glycine ligase [Lacticaseibacillus yichunensis]
MVNVLIVGNGARESALGKAFLAAPEVDQVFVAPGNAGMPLLGLTTVPVTENDQASLIEFARQHVALTFIGPEAPLAAGIVDAFSQAGLPVFGPTQQIAQLESSKEFAKAFMARHQLPTAQATLVHSLQEAQAQLAKGGVPVVIKENGLAAGKGVTVALDLVTANAALAKAYADNPYAAVLLEEYLSGEEVSVMALFNGMSRVILPLSQDHKRRFDHDEGPNTGGMGAYSPAPQFSQAQRDQARALVDQTLAGMTVDGLYGCGVLYIGLMFTAAGPKILEYNLRFGDPETQVLLPQIQNDFYQLIQDLLAGKQPTLRLDGQTYCGVVAVHPGYPEATRPSVPVVLPDAHQRTWWVPAGVARGADGLKSSGGRIFTVIGAGADLAEAQAEAYARMTALQGTLACRSDIGWHALA